MTGDRSLKDELARLDIHVLSAGVLLQVALMPLVLYGEIASRTLPPTLLAVTFGLEAVFVLLMVIKLSRSRTPYTATTGRRCDPIRWVALPAGQRSEEGSQGRRTAKCAKLYCTPKTQP
jgi:hypothetical protein